MSLVLKIKTPTGNKRVSITSINLVNKQSKRRKLVVKIRLPSNALNVTSTDDLSSLEDELNDALNQTTETSAEPNNSIEESNVRVYTPEPNFNVTLHYSPERVGKSGNNSLMDGIVQETPTTSPIPMDILFKDTGVNGSEVTGAGVKESNVKEFKEEGPDTEDPVIKPQTLQQEQEEELIDTENYRTIPSNLTLMLKKEFGSSQDEEEIGMIEKMIFTLRDPLSASKIKLPVKSIVCSHFECFDFDNFCTFSRIPGGVSRVLRKDLYKRAYEAKKQYKLLEESNGKDLNSINILQLRKNLTYQPSLNEFKNIGSGYKNYYPVYKCPVCNHLFELNQLFISDIFNYFIKTTPAGINRIELRDMVKYRIIDDRIKPQTKKEHEEVVLLSDDEDDDNEPIRHPNSWDNGFNIVKNSEIAQDSIDDEETEEEDWIRGYSSSPDIVEQYSQPTGSGSWADPVTLD